MGVTARESQSFYRGLILHRSVHLGDTLYTRTKVVGLRQNKTQANRAATGIVALEMTTTNQHGETVLHFWRCPMIPCRDAAACTGHDDDLDQIGAAVTPEKVIAALPTHWNLAPAERWLGWRHNALAIDDHVVVEARDTVTSAPELVRLSLNMAMAHTDSTVSYLGERLVFGGHTIFTCFAQITRALPNLLTLIAWENCDHLAPVLEGDLLRTTFDIRERVPYRRAAPCCASRPNATRPEVYLRPKRLYSIGLFGRGAREHESSRSRHRETHRPCHLASLRSPLTERRHGDVDLCA